MNSNERTMTQRGVVSLLDYCRQADWAGHDPYDALNSRLFERLPFLNSRWPRLLMTQGLKRLPINLRGLLQVPRGLNPKGAALFLSSLIRLEKLGLSTTSEIQGLADRLVGLRTPGWRRMCWGYHFPWQTRSYLVPRYYPNVICTTFAAEALLDTHERFGDSRWLEAAVDAGWFLMEELKRTEGSEGFCFSYTPLEPTQVHNASLLAAALLARLTAATGISEFREAAIAAARYGIAQQRPDGSWVYGESPKQGWIDSFHTGFNLLALAEVTRHVPMEAVDLSIRKGFDFYRRFFFQPGGIVKYFHDRVYPIDSHAVAHAILTLVELAHLDSSNLTLAGEVVRWAMEHMRHPKGYFYYQKWPWFTNRVEYIRWTQAWMLRGLTEYLVRSEPAAR